MAADAATGPDELAARVTDGEMPALVLEEVVASPPPPAPAAPAPATIAGMVADQHAREEEAGRIRDREQREQRQRTDDKAYARPQFTDLFGPDGWWDAAPARRTPAEDPLNTQVDEPQQGHPVSRESTNADDDPAPPPTRDVTDEPAEGQPPRAEEAFVELDLHRLSGHEGTEIEGGEENTGEDQALGAADPAPSHQTGTVWRSAGVSAVLRELGLLHCAGKLRRAGLTDVAAVCEEGAEGLAAAGVGRDDARRLLAECFLRVRHVLDEQGDAAQRSAHEAKMDQQNLPHNLRQRSL
eukprot:gene1168-62271_t